MKRTNIVLRAMRWPTLAKALSALMAAVLVALPGAVQSQEPLWEGLYPQMGEEVIFLSDSCECGDVTRLFRVNIDETVDPATAELDQVGQTMDYLQVDCLAATPDGTRLYLVEKWLGSGGAHVGPSAGKGKIGYLDLKTGLFHNADGSDPMTGTPTYLTVGGDCVPLISGQLDCGPEEDDRIDEVVLGAFSPNGILYVASQTTEELYMLDVLAEPTSGVATSLGKIYVHSTDDYVNLHGADIAFSADGRLFVWANFPNPANETVAPRGLYEVTLADPPGYPTAQLVDQTFGCGLGDDPNRPRLTGLAFRWNGLFAGDPPVAELAGSTCCDNVVIFPLEHTTPAEIVDDVRWCEMCDCGGIPYAYTFGDMSNGPLLVYPCVGTIGYWKNHPWPESVTLCADTDYETMIDESTGQAILASANNTNFSMLTAQLIAAKLNTIDGPDGVVVGEAEEAFLCEQTAGDWDMPFSSEEQKEEAEYYKDALDAFNNGETDISSQCDD
jgi:hypothetical protein